MVAMIPIVRKNSMKKILFTDFIQIRLLAMMTQL